MCPDGKAAGVDSAAQVAAGCSNFCASTAVTVHMRVSSETFLLDKIRVCLLRFWISHN